MIGTRVAPEIDAMVRHRMRLIGAVTLLCGTSLALPAAPTDVQIEIDAQLVAGYSRNTAQKGLKTYMPDYNDLGTLGGSP